jgi:DNA replication protein DnaC
MKLFERSGISRFGFKDYDAYNGQLIIAKESAIHYTKQFNEIRNDKYNSIALLGQPGSGKTHLGSAISNNLMTQGIPVVYALYTELIPKLKQSYMDFENYNKELGRLKNAAVLFLDDLFKEYSDADIKYVFEVVNHRNTKRLPMIISSEKTMNEILNIDVGTGRRILEMCKNHTVELIGRELNYSLK